MKTASASDRLGDSLHANLPQRSVAKVRPPILPSEWAKLVFDVAPCIEVWREGRGVKRSLGSAIDNLETGSVGSVSEEYI